MVRAMKKEAGARARREEGESSNGSNHQEAHDRRVLRSRYLAVKNLISDEREDITRIDSDKFNSIFTEVECLHKLVQKPREQVADAEALLDITNTLLKSVKFERNDGISPSNFVSALLKNFGQQDGGAIIDNASNMVSWIDIGLYVSHIFRKVPGCCTMVGPMTTEMKQRKLVVQRKRLRPTASTCPEELMRDAVEPGEELMPHRNNPAICGSSSQSEPVHTESQPAAAPPATPIRKLTRNRGLIIQEQAIVQDSLENGSPPNRDASKTEGEAPI